MRQWIANARFGSGHLRVSPVHSRPGTQIRLGAIAGAPPSNHLPWEVLFILSAPVRNVYDGFYLVRLHSIHSLATQGLFAVRRKSCKSRNDHLRYDVGCVKVFTKCILLDVGFSQ